MQRADQTVAIATLQSKSNLSLPHQTARIFGGKVAAPHNCFSVEGSFGLMGILLFRLRGVN
jgi:hypothetical protein